MILFFFSHNPTNNDKESNHESEASFHSVKSSFSDSRDTNFTVVDPIFLLKQLSENETDTEKNIHITSELLKIDIEDESLKLVCNYGLYHTCSILLESKFDQRSDQYYLSRNHFLG